MSHSPVNQPKTKTVRKLKQYRIAQKSTTGLRRSLVVVVVDGAIVSVREIFVGDDDDADGDQADEMTSMSPRGLALDIFFCFLFNQCYLVEGHVPAPSAV